MVAQTDDEGHQDGPPERTAKAVLGPRHAGGRTALTNPPKTNNRKKAKKMDMDFKKK
jgi:hypothetical protein